MKNILLLFCLLAGAVLPAWACTSAVVSGKATPDGRPLLWKHRDTDFLKNHVEARSTTSLPWSIAQTST